MRGVSFDSLVSRILLDFFVLRPRRPPRRTRFPYTTLFRSRRAAPLAVADDPEVAARDHREIVALGLEGQPARYDFPVDPGRYRSEEHTSELQSRGHLVCRLLLEKKNTDRALLEPADVT